MRAIEPEQPITLDYEAADYLVTAAIFRKAIDQAARQAKQAQAAKPAPHPSGLNRRQRRAQRR